MTGVALGPMLALTRLAPSSIRPRCPAALRNRDDRARSRLGRAMIATATIIL
jgi:hypothetical protein